MTLAPYLRPLPNKHSQTLNTTTLNRSERDDKIDDLTKRNVVQIGAAFACEEKKITQMRCQWPKQLPTRPGALPTIAVGAASRRAVKLVAELRFKIPHLIQRPLP